MKVKVIGVGSAGNKVVNAIAEVKPDEVDFIAIDSDQHILTHSFASEKIDIGRIIGLDGSDVRIIEKFAEDSRNEIVQAIGNADLVFVVAGMGGIIGSGAAPVVADVAKKLGALTVAVVTEPFEFEGEKRVENAESSIAKLKETADAVIVVSNDSLIKMADEKIGMEDFFKSVDDVLKNSILGITDLMSESGLMNLEFEDIANLMQNAGVVHIGIGAASGENRAINAVKQAVESLVFDADISDMKDIMLSICADSDLSMLEVMTIAQFVQAEVKDDVNLVFGAVADEKKTDGELRVTIYAKGY